VQDERTAGIESVDPVRRVEVVLERKVVRGRDGDAGTDLRGVRAQGREVEAFSKPSGLPPK